MQKIHMMGIMGSGMAGVATLASKIGYQVTGCDLKTGGHDPKHLKNIDLLVVSPAVLYQNNANPELLQGYKKKIVMTWEEFVGKYLMKNKYVIAIAGTHGKSTTTAMVGQILEDAGLDPTILVGASVPKWNGNARYGKSKYFVIEADEFNDNFLNYKPDILVINNIEFDHPDYFKDERQLYNSFNKLINNLKDDKIVITGCHPAKLKQMNIDITGCHPVVLNLKRRFNLKVFGEHNQKNANIAYLVGRQLKIKKEEVIKSLENFKGIGRRMELLGKTKNGTLIFDDYAHHPTAIKTTLEGLRVKYPDKKILAIIEPHGYKRTKALLPPYKNAFDSVDSVIIGPIFKARDEVDKSINIRDIAKVSKHKNIEVVNSLDELIKNLKLTTKSGELIKNYHVVVIMGAGNSNLWAQKIIKSL